MAMSKVKQNFHSDSEALINKQINMELYASYVYLSLVRYNALCLQNYEILQNLLKIIQHWFLILIPLVCLLCP